MDTSVRGSASRCCSVAPLVSTTTRLLRLLLRKWNLFFLFSFRLLSRYLHRVSPNIKQHNWLFLLSLFLCLVFLLYNTVSLPCARQVHPRLHLVMGDPGPHPGHVTRHVLPFHPQCDAASPHAASVRTGGSRTQLGGDLLGGHPHLHMVSGATKCFSPLKLKLIYTFERT